MDADELDIVYWPDPVLQAVATPIDTIDDYVHALAGRMIELMYEADGIGLAAPQVGISRRLFVTRDPGNDDDAVVWINPSIEVIDDTPGDATEGCLSLPDIDICVRRPVGIRITGQNLQGETLVLESDEHIARVWQHEFDHLEGRLITDRMSTMDRLRTRKALRTLRQREF